MCETTKLTFLITIKLYFLIKSKLNSNSPCLQIILNNLRYLILESFSKQNFLPTGADPHEGEAGVHRGGEPRDEANAEGCGETALRQA